MILLAMNLCIWKTKNKEFFSEVLLKNTWSLYRAMSQLRKKGLALSRDCVRIKPLLTFWELNLQTLKGLELKV